MDDKKHRRTFWTELFVNILKISFTRWILTRQLKSRWFSRDCFKRALTLGWNKQLVLLEKVACDSSNRKPGVCTSVRNTPPVTQLIQPEGTQLCLRIQQDVVSSEAPHVLDQFGVGSNSLFFLLIAITSQRISGNLFPRSIYASLFGRRFPSFIVHTCRKPFQLGLQLLTFVEKVDWCLSLKRCLLRRQFRIKYPLKLFFLLLFYFLSPSRLCEYRKTIFCNVYFKE